MSDIISCKVIPSNLILLDYANGKVDTGLLLRSDILEEIREIRIRVLSGDEVATVTWNDDTKTVYDSSENRAVDFYDGEYVLYDREQRISRLGAFLERKDSYDMFSLKNGGEV